MDNTATQQPKPWNYVSGFVLCSALGFVLGLVFSLFGLVASLFSGVDGPSVSEIAIYFFGFCASGLLAGVLNPIGRRITGAAILGVIALIPAGMAWSQLDYDRVIPPDPDAAVSIIAVVIIFGICFGLFAWDLFVKPRGGRAPWTSHS